LPPGDAAVGAVPAWSAGLALVRSDLRLLATGVFAMQGF
jgi:hypothetical protein